MKLTVHRGTHQIGGSCVELQAAGQRLILDLGLPLVAPDGEQFRIGGGDHDPAALVAAGGAPPVTGLYADATPQVAAVFLTHAHLDHAGLGRYVHPAIPVYANEGTLALLDASRIFLPFPTVLPQSRLLPKRQPLRIGPFQVTAIPVDHAAPDAVALLIETERKRILYSGDLRAHGRKAYLFRSLLENPPHPIDLLLLEGTTAGRPDRMPVSEEALEEQFVAALRAQRSLSLVFCSAQNVDRLVTVFRAAKRTGKTLVIDLYTAYVLRKLRCLSCNLPQYDWDGIRVVPWGYQQQKLRDGGQEEFLAETAASFIGYREILRCKRGLVLMARSNSTLLRLGEKLSGNLDGIQVIWSLWGGYWAADSYARPFCERNSIQPVQLHTSGHASWADLQRLVAAIQPRRILPVHTEHPERFAREWQNTLVAADGQAIGI